MAEEEVIDWAQREAERKKKKADNRDNGQRLLTENGIAFTVHNKGAHLVVVDGACTWDYWPGTGKWCMRGTSNYRRGVFPLIQAVHHERRHHG